MSAENTSAEVLPRQVLGVVPIHLPRERRLTLFALTCLIFFMTCGGPFGLEGLVGTVGAGWAMVLIVVTPVIWSLPMALMVAELTTLMPEEGGYYVWVRETLGPFWGVQEAWWTMGYSVALLASFAVLFVSYLGFFVPGLGPSADGARSVSGALIRWLVAALVVVTATVVNLRGARGVGRSAKICAAFVVGAFAVMVLVWLGRTPAPGEFAGAVSRDLGASHPGALLVGLSIISFNYSGWDNVSTFAGEVDEPQRNYPRAIGMALVVVVLTYLLPVIAGVSVTTDPAIWTADAGWPVIAGLIGGHWLGSLIAAAGLVSTWALFNAQLLYVSRLPFVMACDGWLPRAVAKVSRDTAVPSVAILIFGGITALFAVFSFVSLAVILCLLATAALTLEFLALIILRIRRPAAPRNFRVPGGWWGLGVVCVMPFAAAAVVLFATLRDWRSYPGQIVVVAGVAASGVILYFLRRRSAISPKGHALTESKD
jgi:amino acid transporter